MLQYLSQTQSKILCCGIIKNMKHVHWLIASLLSRLMAGGLSSKTEKTLFVEEEEEEELPLPLCLAELRWPREVVACVPEKREIPLATLLGMNQLSSIIISYSFLAGRVWYIVFLSLPIQLLDLISKRNEMQKDRYNICQMYKHASIK